MEKNARRTGIIVKIHYGRGRRGGVVHESALHTPLAARGRNGVAARTRLSIVIKTKPGNDHTEE